MLKVKKTYVKDVNVVEVGSIAFIVPRAGFVNLAHCLKPIFADAGEYPTIRNLQWSAT